MPDISLINLFSKTKIIQLFCIVTNSRTGNKTDWFGFVNQDFNQDFHLAATY